MIIKKHWIFVLFLSFLLLFSSCDGENLQSNSEPDTNETLSTEAPSMTTAPQGEVLNHTDIKAMWLSQFDLTPIYTSNGKQRQCEDFTAKIYQVLENVKNNGYNTVFLQVRPNGDSFYPSDIYPPSKYVTGSYGYNFDYDPIPIIIEKAHALSLSIHAWINPLRCMDEKEINLVDEKYLLKKWFNDKQKNSKYTVIVNGRIYLNPAYPEVRQLIADGVRELLDKYPFDGVHNDDYFYPTTATSFDFAAYNEYCSKNGKTDVWNFRTENLNKLIALLYSTVKTQNPNLLYGISPEGNINNAINKSYADVKTWCSRDGYVDYICPQVYFGLEHQTHPFDKVSSEWSNIITNKDIDLVIGMTLGKAYSKYDKWAGSGQNEWAENTDILKKCLEHTLALEKCIGVSVFCYQYYYDPLSGSVVENTEKELKTFTPLLKTISWKTLE